ncbi:MAG: hypothetical protein KAI73_11960, partial [Rhodospirillaceae bacterium]|nr:hypothetical protein [Rhodospirillaceae bacterium]
MGRNINPRPQFLDSAGDPLISGKMYYFESGTDTPKATFADVNMTIQNTHPVILTGDGRLPNVFLIGTARMKLTDADDVQLWDIDPTGGDDIGGNFEEWVPSVVYNANDIVQGSDGKFYLSFTNGNLGNDPTTTPTEWQEIQFINVWNTNVTYQIGNTVIGSDNLFYVSQTADNLGNDPTSDAINWGPPFDAVVSITGGTGITISGTASVPIVTADNNGTVTSVATAGLATGGPITGTGTVTVPKAIASEVATGTDDTKAVTSLAMADALLGANNLSGVADPAASATNLGLGTGDAVAFATVNTGNGDNELFAMDQDVKTTDDVTFNSVAGVAQTDCQLVYNSTTEIQLMMAGGKFVTVNGSPLDISSEPTLANTGLTAGDTLYGYLFDDGGTPTIELSTTVPAAGADGIDIKTG